MSQSFYERPILNSPYEAPQWHHALDDEGQPTDQPPIEGRRDSRFIVPVPKPKKKSGLQKALDLGMAELATPEQEFNPTPIINEIRTHVASWRALRSPADWGVTPITARLLTHWRTHSFEDVRPFFCQVEAVETLIWLTEVARRERRYAKFWDHVKGANAQTNPDLLRIAMKMATGTGKTTVMAMIIAWQCLNAVRTPNSNLFSRGFLTVTPGITIKDRLRVLMPEAPDSYYRERELVPPDMVGELGKAKIVLTNYHAFKRREVMEISKVGRALLQGRGEAPETIETEGQMLQRACGELMALKNIVVINDEAHHCYRHKVKSEDEEESLSGDEKDEAKKNNEAARLWISGLQSLNSNRGVRAVYDLSATPFFLRGSGYPEGTLFPWTVSDFSLMDAIESGIVKLPRVPVADNLPTSNAPMYRNLWEHIGKKMPKSGKSKAGKLDPLSLPAELQTALYALYGHYEKIFDGWQKAAIPVPPVFIVVCNNTASSHLVYQWISGWDRDEEDGERRHMHDGHLALFRNFDGYGDPLPRPATILIDSEQLESGEALDTNFRDIAKPEIERFKAEKAQREGAASAEGITDAELLREVMNTVGKRGRLGEQVRCVVSVSMLTAGTGKTVVALHRAVRLARDNPGARVLLTTFSQPLAEMLERKLSILERSTLAAPSGSGGSLDESAGQFRTSAKERIQAVPSVTVTGFHGLAGELYQLAFERRHQIAPRDIIQSLLAKAAKAEDVADVSMRFLMSEWDQVIDAWQLNDESAYAAVPRLGRRNRMSAKQRARLWPIFASVRASLAQKKLTTWATVCGDLCRYYSEKPVKPFDHVVVDEAQDLGVAELRLLAAIAPQGVDALFFAGDLGQRIFQQPFSWLALGVDVRGRSQTLRVNYRTSHQIRETADRLLPGLLRDVDGNEERRAGTVSVFNGPEPAIGRYATPELEIAGVANWIAEAIREGMAVSEIAVFVRENTEIDRARAAVKKAGRAAIVLSDRSASANGIAIGAMHHAKGMEYRAVVVMACDAELLPLQARVESAADEAELDDVYETERQLLYVACTRARDRLLVTGVQPVSEFVDDMEGGKTHAAERPQA